MAGMAQGGLCRTVETVAGAATAVTGGPSL
jgi:hypothetical protein